MARGPSILPEDWLRSPEDRRRRRVISVDLEGERFDPIFKYATAVNPDRSVQESIRDLLLQAVADEPMNAALREARRQVYREVKERVLRDITGFLRQLAGELELEPIAEDVSNLPEPGNRIIDKDPESIF